MTEDWLLTEALLTASITPPLWDGRLAGSCTSFPLWNIPRRSSQGVDILSNKQALLFRNYKSLVLSIQEEKDEWYKSSTNGLLSNKQAIDYHMSEQNAG